VRRRVSRGLDAHRPTIVTVSRLRRLARDSWAIARPYWFSEDRWPALRLLVVVIALTLGLVYVNVLINRWNNTFYNALQEKNYAVFVRQVIRFSWLAIAYIVVAVYQLYLDQMLLIRWRRWLTERYLRAWLTDRAYYRMQLAGGESDNPDQRIADDVRLFISGKPRARDRRSAGRGDADLLRGNPV